MLLMAVSGAAVLAVVCWAALRESTPAITPFIPQQALDGQQGERAGGRGSEGEGARQRAGGRGSEGEGAHEPDVVASVHDALNGVGPRPVVLCDATVADADVGEALAANAALWRVLAQRGV